MGHMRPPIPLESAFPKEYAACRMRLLPLLLIISFSSSQLLAEEEFSFDRDIRPILSDKCFHCHGPDENERKADLRLDTFEGATRDLGGYSAIVPGDLDESELIYRILSDDPTEVMPTPKSHLKLTSKEKELLQAWVKSGGEYEGHWAFEPVKQPKVPTGAHPVDHFIQKRLKSSGLTMNGPATAQTLARRMALDLTGLPIPAVRAKEFEKAYQDSPSEAVDALLDDLFASPHYGERMAWDWLDVSRYADTNGYQGDRERTMWPWRDWVIKAFQANMPWDQFTRWQLAGDQMKNPSREQILATGFSRNHPINGEGGRIPEENRVEYVFDMTETMGTTWLGLTLECSRCHDHKFDPISQRDYFALNAFFNQTPVTGSGGSGQTAPVLEMPTEAQLQRRKDLEKKRSDAQKQLDEVKGNLRQNQLTDRTILQPTEAKARNQKLVIESTGSILATGTNPDNDTYKVSYLAPEGATTLGSFRLDALQHSSHTPKPEGLARSNSGNFVLTEFEVRVEGQPATIKTALASYAQNNFAIEKAFDGNAETGWAVHRGKPVINPEHAVFYLEQPLKLDPGDRIEVTLRFDSSHAHHNMGRFQLSINDAIEPKPEKPLGIDKENPDYKKALSQVEAINGQIKKLNESVSKVMVMEDMEKPRQTYILNGGLYNQRGEPVDPEIPAIFGTLDDVEKKNRLALANWLVDGQNPLTARVTVNRFWQKLFGTGLVKTSEDFGVQGERPSHPELLDWLAAEFVAKGWDVQHIIRLIITSETYQQSSQVTSEHLAKDPDNRFLARSPRHRLPSWMIRDQALAASGLLVPAIGGAPVKPYQPDGIWAEATFGKKKYTRDEGDKLYRRTIYTFWRRISRPPMLFDSASRLVCDVTPSRTNTPLQALTTMNDVTYIEAARVAAQNEPSTTRLFQKITNRLPTEAELDLLEGRVQSLTSYYQSHPEEAQKLLSEGEFPPPEDADIPTLAARTAVANLIYNLDEVLCRP